MYKWYIRTNCINNKSAHKNEHTEQQLIERKSFYWMPKMVCSICIGRSTHANDAHMFSYSLVVVKISIEPKTFGFSKVWTYNQFWLNNTYALLRAVTVRFRFIYCIAKQTTPWVDVGLILRKLHTNMLVLFYSTFSRRLYLFLFQAISTVEATMA